MDQTLRSWLAQAIEKRHLEHKVKEAEGGQNSRAMDGLNSFLKKIGNGEAGGKKVFVVTHMWHKTHHLSIRFSGDDYIIVQQS